MNLRRGFNAQELQYLRRACGFTKDEEAVFLFCARGESRVKIAEFLRVSVPTVDRRIRRVKEKIQRISP